MFPSPGESSLFPYVSDAASSLNNRNSTKPTFSDGAVAGREDAPVALFSQGSAATGVFGHET
jgi:hypothetical protein